MPVDNDVYNAPADIWWDDTQPLSFLRIAVNPARFGYFHNVLVNSLGLDLTGMEALDIGCGGGFLAEEFARLRCRVMGIDPSGPSLATARAHAALSGLDITYQRATGEDIPFDAERFDIVYCCDVLEHVTDLGRVIAETARVLKPGGVYLYDTINRTLLSKLILIKAAQEWRLTRMVSPGLHDWTMFVKPLELQTAMRRHGIESRGVTGMMPGASPPALLQAFVEYRIGKISYGELAARLTFTRTRYLGISYMGYGVKALSRSGAPHSRP